MALRAEPLLKVVVGARQAGHGIAVEQPRPVTAGDLAEVQDCVVERACLAAMANHGADQAVKADGTSFQEDFAFVDVFSYKIDRRGSFVNVSSSFGFAGNDQVAFSGDARGLSSASLTAQVELQTCNDRGCTAAGTESVSVSWTGTGATTTYKGSVRTNDPGQFTSTGRFTGSSRQATASGTVPVLGTGSAFYGAISSGTSTDRTVCHAC